MDIYISFMSEIDFKKIEKKWQERWEKAGIFKVKENAKKKKFYCLEMFPYPSWSGLHMGHVRNYAMGDCIARFKRMQGFNVLYPMGYDAFGLPAENAAIKNKSHPKAYTENAMAGIEKNQRALGLSYDWTRKFATCEPEYYRWNQWFFLQFFKKGLAYKKEAPVNWCPKCKSVLANEQVENGKCWRCESLVEEKRLEQWFFKITEYAERLLKDLDKLQWPEKIKKMQENWIGKSEGLLFSAKVNGMDITVENFNSVPQMAFADTFYVIAPEHPLVKKLVKGTVYEKKVIDFVDMIRRKKSSGDFSIEKEIEGVFTGRYVEDPLGNGNLPIWVASYALVDYGTGIVKCSAHDERDFRFAKKYGIPLKVVLVPRDSKRRKSVEAFEEFYRDDEGVLIEPKDMEGKNYLESREPMMGWLEQKGFAKRKTNYKFRDWLISRQRYWGTPIPIIYCDKCGMVPVPEKDLPVLLPENAVFTGKGNPLANTEEFVNTKCPSCGGQAKRETDTMDTFVDSSWYFLRFCNPHINGFAFDKKAVNYWMQVDQYIGGAEHAVMHLLYARFFTKVLKDMGLVNFDEPFSRLFNQGIVYKDGHKMSKSVGNVVTQEEMSEKYGIDTARLFLLFVGSPEKEMEWSDKGVEGVYRFVNRVYRLGEHKSGSGSKDAYVESKMNKTIKYVTEEIEGFGFNKAIGKIMDYVNTLHSKSEYISEKAFKKSVGALCLLLSPFMPHLAEELWERLGNKTFVSVERWPKSDPKKIDEKAEYLEDIIDKSVKDIKEVLTLLKIEKPEKINLFVSEDWKYLLFKKVKALLEKTHNTGEILKEVMKDSGMKKHGKDVPGIATALVKDPSKIPEIILNQKEELEMLKKSKEIFEKEFNCKIEILSSDKSASPRAKKAEPGKPGIEII